MVQQNVQTTIGSPIEWYKLEVLRDVVNLKEAWEQYYKDKDQYPVDLNVITARTKSLFSSLVAYLNRKWSQDGKFDKIRKDLFGLVNPDEARLREIFFEIQIQLDKDNITKLDTRMLYDGTRVEHENKNFGL